MRFTHAIDIDRPAEDVFAALTDPSRLPEWQFTTVGVRRDRVGPLRVGERFEEIHAAFGRCRDAFSSTTDD